jgi:hypothetical protein
MKRSFTCLRVLLLSVAMSIPLLGSPGIAAGQYQTNPVKDADGRLRGYDEQNVILDDSSTALTYLALIGLTVVAVGLMFKSSRRTHLD